MRNKDRRTTNRKSWIQVVEHNVYLLSSSYYTHEKGSLSSRSSSPTNLYFTKFMIFIKIYEFMIFSRKLSFTWRGSFVVIPETGNPFSMISG